MDEARGIQRACQGLTDFDRVEAKLKRILRVLLGPNLAHHSDIAELLDLLRPSIFGYLLHKATQQNRWSHLSTYH
jgi:hypothetical protein